jgi:drug/metabolite transporter (DMT)-like permease
VLSRVSSTQASLVGYIVPLVALVAGVVILDERLQVGIAAGGVLILIGVVLTDRSERARLAHT